MKTGSSDRYYFRVLMPSLVFLLITILTVAQWRALGIRRRDMYRIRMERQASRVCFYIQEDLESRIAALERAADRWKIQGETSYEEFAQFSADLIEDKPGFQAIKWVDPSYQVRWLLPLSGNEEDEGKEFTSREGWLKFLEISRSGQDSIITPLYDLGNSNNGFRIIVPLFPKNQFEGFLLAKFYAQEWLDTLFRSGESYVFYKTIIIRVKMDGETVYHSQEIESPYESYGASKKISFRNHTFSVRCVPREDFFQEMEKDQSLFILILGIVQALTLGAIVFLLQNSSLQKHQRQEARTALKEALQSHHLTEKEMTALNTRLTLATTAGKIGVWTWDLETDALEWNNIMYELYGLPYDAIPDYKAWKDRIHPGDLERIEKEQNEAIEGKAPYDTVLRIRKRDGEEKVLRAAATVKRDASGRAFQMIGIDWDITRMKEAEISLENQKQRLEDILEGTNVGTWEWDITTGETIFNERWANIIGYSLEELSPVSINTWVRLTHPDDLKKSDELLQKHFRGEIPYYECEARMKHKDGHWVWVLDRGRVTRRSPEGEALLMSGTHADITERKTNEEKILHMAVHDALTDLPTLRLARDRLTMTVHMARRSGNKAAVMFIDLDRFKWVNDNYGHDIGDEVLIHVAGILRDCIRESDTAARMGGDEFLVLLTEIRSPENARNIAEKLVSQLSSPFIINGKGITISASIGIALYPDNGEEPEDLIRNADRAMYRIKNTGKNGFTFA